MAGIASSDVSYSISKKKLLEDGRKIIQATITFGDGALTYPSGGVPLSKGKLGCPVVIDSLKIVGTGASGYMYEYDTANVKLRLLQSPVRTHVHDILVKGGQAASTTNDIAHYATDILGKEAATDATIAGSASATKGGVVSATLAAVGLSELATSVAPAAQSVVVEVIGY